MPLFWFLAGMSTAVAIICVLLPWLRTIPRFGALPSLPWQVSMVAILVVALVLVLYHWFGRPELVQGESSGVSNAQGSTGMGAAGSAATRPANAGSMQSAVASLESRLAKGGASADDWELLAKSYDFLGRPDAAAAARRHVLPNHEPPGAENPGDGSTDAARISSVSGEVSLANDLLARVPADGTLFIVAKSVDSPGPPLAVFRSSVGAWPVKFTLDDSNAMLPGRNLSSAGRVTVEARISQSGQALPASGDLRGSTGVLDPAQRRSLKLVIDEVVR